MGTIRTDDLHHRWRRGHSTDRELVHTAGKALPHASILQPLFNEFSLSRVELHEPILTY